MGNTTQSSPPVNREELAAKAAAFRKLHEGPKTLLLPNAWDGGSAAVLAAAGFPVIATTSAGIAVARGFPDGERIGRDEMLAEVNRIVRTVPVPVTADLEAGYGPNPEDVAETVRRAIAVGAAGANFEDGTTRGGRALMDFSHAVERIRAAREAADAEGIPFVVNARTDGFLVSPGQGAAVFDEAVRRANAFHEAGADCLFVPGKLDRETIANLAKAINGPLNVLGALSGYEGPPIAELEALGVARVSIGGSLSLAVLAMVKRAAQEMVEKGTFSYAGSALSNAEMNKMLGG